jgi:hypothetical protein
MYNAIEVLLDGVPYVIELDDNEIEDIGVDYEHPNQHDIVQEWLYNEMGLEYKLVELDYEEDDNEEIEQHD